LESTERIIAVGDALDRIDRICRIEEREARAPAQAVISPDEDAEGVRLGGELQGIVVGKGS